MTEFALVVFLAVLCLAAAGLYMWRAGAERERRRRNDDRLREALAHGNFDGQPGGTAGTGEWSPPPMIETWLVRAGFTPTHRLYGLLLLPAPALVLAGMLLAHFEGALAGGLLAYPAGLALFLRWRIERLHDQVVAQLPGFVDSVARILSIGPGLELAFRHASDECEEPLRGITQQILLRTRAGMAIEDAMNQVAETYAIKDLSFMASVFYLGIRYGGNARAILERIAIAMHEREHSQKELRAMTAETRTSAWILSALPILVGAMILFSNPAYLRSMWIDQLGHKLLIAAAILQLTGMALLFRMAKLRFR